MYQINEFCVGCHYCELACPMQAVYYDGLKYEIDLELCVECGLCETLCPTCSIEDIDNTLSPKPHEKIIRECDLVVCGGGSGLISAIKAAQLGKKVILLEKSKRVGGSMCLARTFSPIYSRLHAEHGLDDVRDNAVAKLSALTNSVINSDIIHTAVYGCSEFTDWLLEFPDVHNRISLETLKEPHPEFGTAVLSVLERIENKLSKDPSIGPGLMGSLIKKAMLEAIHVQKLDVEILLEHEARHLITDETGRVTGVKANDPGGETDIHCKAVVLATGGFGASGEKLQKYFEFFDIEKPVQRYTVPGNTGDAIDMLLELGVRPDPGLMYMSIRGPSHRPFSYSLCRVFDHPTALLVNPDGKRWMDESVGETERVNASPREAVWGIFTQKNIDDIMQIYISDPSEAANHDCFTYYQEDLDKEAGYRKPPVYKAETVEDLAEKLYIDPVTLKNTVESYNLFCQSGSDEEFGKEAGFLIPREHGPYYAICGRMFSDASTGGLAVDAKCRVLRGDNAPISGLYAGGDVTSAMHRQGETPVVSGLSWAVASAYRCAVEAVNEMEVSV